MVDVGLTPPREHRNLGDCHEERRPRSFIASGNIARRSSSKDSAHRLRNQSAARQGCPPLSALVVTQFDTQPRSMMPTDLHGDASCGPDQLYWGVAIERIAGPCTKAAPSAPFSRTILVS